MTEGHDRVEARLGVVIAQALEQCRRRAAIAELAEDEREIAPDLRIVVLRLRVDRRDLLLEVRILLRFAAIDRARELIRGVPTFVCTAGADRVEVVGNGGLLRGEKAEEEKHADADQNDPQREDDELEEDRARRLFGEIFGHGSEMQNAEFRMQNSEKGR